MAKRQGRPAAPRLKPSGRPTLPGPLRQPPMARQSWAASSARAAADGRLRTGQGLDRTSDTPVKRWPFVRQPLYPNHFVAKALASPLLRGHTFAASALLGGPGGVYRTDAFLEAL